MMLGRADGALVFDYLIPHRPRLRTLAADLCTEIRTPVALITRAKATLADLPAGPPATPA
jgi:hypothetical protein